jgi:hypothetical protein
LGLGLGYLLGEPSFDAEYSGHCWQAPWLVWPCTSLYVSAGQSMAMPAEHLVRVRAGVRAKVKAQVRVRGRVRWPCRLSTRSQGSRDRTPPCSPDPRGRPPCQRGTASARSFRWHTWYVRSRVRARVRVSDRVRVRVKARVRLGLRLMSGLESCRWCTSWTPCSRCTQPARTRPCTCLRGTARTGPGHLVRVRVRGGIRFTGGVGVQIGLLGLRLGGHRFHRTRQARVRVRVRVRVRARVRGQG